MAYSSVALVILDGWGVAPAWGGNAISQARTPFMSWLDQQPHAVLEASGSAVGLSGHERGNSEVGHLNLGAGRVVLQDSTRISSMIKDGSFDKSETLHKAFTKAQQTNKTVHMMGLLSKTAIHASIDHVYALINLAHLCGVKDLRLHVFTDGRDSDPRDGLADIMEVEDYMSKLGLGRIQTVTGRYYAMDRDQHWSRIQPVYEMLTQGRGQKVASARLAVSQAYSNSITDEFILPTIVETADSAFVGINNDETVVFWNFRADRAHQLTEALTQENFRGFTRSRLLQGLNFISLTSYGAGHELPNVQVAFPPEPLKNTLAQTIAEHGGRQFHIAETEKYAHVTYFFNGGIETPLLGEERVMIPSQSVATFDLAPAMSAVMIRESLEGAIRKKVYQLLVANFANADMVGHTGNFRATLETIETIDAQLNRLAITCQKNQTPLIITADHGNAEELVNPKTGEPSTDHSTNPVPAYFVMSNDFQLRKRTGVLADIAPTILDLLGVPQPTAMTGQSLI